MQSLREISESLGLCKDTVRRGMLKLGIKGEFRKNIPGKADLLFTTDEINAFKKSYEEKNKQFEGFYTTSQIADMLNCSKSWISYISCRYKIDHALTSDHNSKVAYYSQEAVNKILEIAELKKKQKCTPQKITEIAQQQTASAEDHPLVKDLRCLNFRYWPDIVPNCFKELDE